MVWLSVSGRIRAGRVESDTSGMAANIATWQSGHWHNNKGVCVRKENKRNGDKD